MKQITALILALCLCIGLCACGKSDAVVAVENQIAGIGDITLDSEQSILDAERALAALTDVEKGQVDNLDQLTQMRETYDRLVQEAEEAQLKREAEEARLELEAKISEIENLISAIGTVTLDQECIDAVALAREYYDASTSDVQSGVKNISVLVGAEEKLINLQAQSVIQAIADIGEISKDSGDYIKAAEALYEALPKEAQGKVTNLQELKDAKETYQQLKKDEAFSLLKTFRLENDEVRGMKFYNSEKQPYYADERSYVFPYIGMDNTGHIWLCAQFHYTGDDWVFFKKITFAIDEQRYTRTFNYFSDIVRDNAYGNVWEYDNTGDGDQYKDIFENIANSEKTIVRFEGDDYWYDLTVSSGDKAAILEVLTAYQALLDAGYQNY